MPNNILGSSTTVAVDEETEPSLGPTHSSSTRMTLTSSAAATSSVSNAGEALIAHRNNTIHRGSDDENEDSHGGFGNHEVRDEGDSLPAQLQRRRVEPFTSISTDSIIGTVWHRISVLVSLLLLQSLSQFILERYETLLSEHVIVPLFLTMLVGAGGNAGNQSAVRAITGLVSGEFKARDFWRVLRKEIIVGFINAFILAMIGFSRVYYFYGHRNLFYSTVAITLSLFCIVFSSVVLGTSLPFLLGRLGYDREHAAPVIQVTMDITGVLITCAMCTAIIPESEHTSKASG